MSTTQFDSQGNSWNDVPFGGNVTQSFGSSQPESQFFPLNGSTSPVSDAFGANAWIGVPSEDYDGFASSHPLSSSRSSDDVSETDSISSVESDEVVETRTEKAKRVLKDVAHQIGNGFRPFSMIDNPEFNADIVTTIVPRFEDDIRSERVEIVRGTQAQVRRDDSPRLFFLEQVVAGTFTSERLDRLNSREDAVSKKEAVIRALGNTFATSWNTASAVAGAPIGLVQSIIGQSGKKVNAHYLADVIGTSVAAAIGLFIKPIVFVATLVTVVVFNTFKTAGKAALRLLEKLVAPIVAKIAPHIAKIYDRALSKEILAIHADRLAKVYHLAGTLGMKEIQQQVALRITRDINPRVAELGMQERLGGAIGGIFAKVPSKGFYFNGKVEKRFDDEHKVNIANDPIPTNRDNLEDYAVVLLSEVDSYHAATDTTPAGYDSGVIEGYMGKIASKIAQGVNILEARRAARNAPVTRSESDSIPEIDSDFVGLD